MQHIFRTVSFLLVLLAVEMGLCLIFPLCAFASGYGLIEDDAHVLSVSQVSQAAERLPYQVDIYTTSSFRGNQKQLTQLAKQHLPSKILVQTIIIVIDTSHNRVAIVGSVSVLLSNEQYREAEHGFLDSLRYNPSYSDATVTALALLAGSSQSETLFNSLILLVSVGGLVCLYFILRPFLRTPPIIIVEEEEQKREVE